MSKKTNKNNLIIIIINVHEIFIASQKVVKDKTEQITSSTFYKRIYVYNFGMKNMTGSHSLPTESSKH